jgi:hypothetical protein
MVPWWKRICYGLMSWAASLLLVGIPVSIWVFTQSPPPVGQVPHRESGWASATFGFFGFYALYLITAIALSVFGWLLGVPYVLLVRSSRGWRFWVYLAFGSSIGPALVLCAVLTRTGYGGMTTDDYGTFCLSTAVSSVTTLIYLLLLRRAQLAGHSAGITGSPEVKLK